MLLILTIVAGLLQLTPADGQDICNYDPDTIFFDNSHLEELRRAMQRGDCSPPSVGWKMDNNMPSNSEESSDLSDKNREVTKQSRDQRNSRGQQGTRVRFPDDSPNILLPHISRKLHLHKKVPSENSYAVSKNNRRYRPLYFTNKFGSESRQKRQIEQPGFFRPNPSILRQPKLFSPNKERFQNKNYLFPFDFQNQRSRHSQASTKNQRRIQVGDGISQFRPSSLSDFSETPVRLVNQRRLQNQNLFIPNSKIRPGNFKTTDVFSTPNGKVKPQLGSNESRKQQNQGPVVENLFRPNIQGPSPAEQNPSQRQRRPSNQRRPQSDAPPSDESRPMTTTSALETTTLPGPPTWATPPSLCVQRCPNTPEYNPVCGSDRITYINPGRLRCERQCGKGSVNLNHYGTCGTTTTPSTTSTEPSSTTTPAATPPTTRRTSRTRTTTTSQPL